MGTAIEEEGLVLFSQPIIDMASGVPCAEELLSLIDPVNGRPIIAGDSCPPPNGSAWLATSISLGSELPVPRADALGRHVSANISAATHQ